MSAWPSDDSAEGIESLQPEVGYDWKAEGIRRRHREKELRDSRQLPWKDRVAQYFAELKHAQDDGKGCQTERHEASNADLKRKYVQISDDSGQPVDENEPPWRKRRECAQASRTGAVEAEAVSDANYGLVDPLQVHAAGLDPDQRRVARESLIGKRFDGFLALPPELRNRIYSYGLVRGKIYMHNMTTRPAHHLDYDYDVSLNMKYVLDWFRRPLPRYRELYHYGKNPPETALLQVSKQISQEAASIMWSADNLFIIPIGGDGNLQSFIAKCVSYAFDRREADLSCGLDYRREAIANEGLSYEEANDELSNEEMQDKLHADKVDFLLGVLWSGRTERLQSSPRLSHLQIDLHNCYCPDGCCRLVDDLCLLGIPGSRVRQ